VFGPELAFEESLLFFSTGDWRQQWFHQLPVAAKPPHCQILLAMRWSLHFQSVSGANGLHELREFLPRQLCPEMVHQDGHDFPVVREQSVVCVAQLREN
jgi:hypothetical protein